MSKKNLLIALCAAGSTACATGTSAVPVAVSNSSFESHAGVPGGTVGFANVPIDDWTTFGTVLVFSPEDPGATFYNPQDVLILPGQGDWLAGTQSGLSNAGAGGSGLYQTLAETYVEGVEYTFSLWVGGSYESPGGTNTIGFATTAEDLNGPLLASNSVAFPAAGPNWVQNSVSYTATAADAGQNIRIILGTTDANGSQTFDLTEVDAVPEPSSLALLALGGLLAARRRRSVS